MIHTPLIFLDIETNGGNSEGGRITDIGALRIENGEVVSTYNQLVNPQTPIPRFITELTGITNEMAWSAPTFEAIASGLEEFLSGGILIAHSVNFDYGFLKREFARVGVTFNMNRACSVKLSRALHPEHRRHGLDYIIERMGLAVENRHRGFDDAEVLYKFFTSELEINGMELFKILERQTTHARRPKTYIGPTASLFI